MTRDVCLTSQDWCEIVFEGKNQSYGAFYLRQSSSNRHIKAMVIVLATIVAAVTVPTLIRSVAPPAELPPPPVEGGVVLTRILPDLPKPIVPVAPLPEATKPLKIKASIKFVPPVIDRHAPETDMATQNQLNADRATVISFATNPGDPEGIDPNSLRRQIAPPTPDPNPKRPILYKVDYPPMFPGGKEELAMFLSNNIVYPSDGVINGVEGDVIVRFAVMENGVIDKVEVVRSTTDPSFEQEAIRLVKSMPAWIPGKKDGKNVAVYFTLPIRFKLGN